MLSHRPLFTPMAGRPISHCSTLAVLHDGSLISAWFAGSDETAPDIAIVSAQLDATGREWSPPRVIADVANHSMGQPVFLLRPDGELWLFFDVLMKNEILSSDNPFNLAAAGMGSWNSAQPFLQRSEDGGKTWGAPRQFFDRPGLMFRSRPVVLPGRIVLPAYDEIRFESQMMVSDDDGESWHTTEPIRTPQGNIQPAVVALPNGDLLAYLRTGGSGGAIWRTTSSDAGDTWSQPEATQIPNPNAGIDLLRLQNGALILAFNHSDHQRTPLCVMLADEGENWLAPKTIASGDPEFSYPCLAQTQDGLIHLVYTYRRQHIQYARFSEDWLREA